MRTFLSRLVGGSSSRFIVKKTRFGEVLTGLRLGAAYAFDEEACNRFFPLAQQHGLGLGPEEFSDPGPPGAVHLVRVQWQPIGRGGSAGLLRSVARQLSRAARQLSGSEQ